MEINQTKIDVYDMFWNDPNFSHFRHSLAQDFQKVILYGAKKVFICNIKNSYYWSMNIRA